MMLMSKLTSPSG